MRALPGHPDSGWKTIHPHLYSLFQWVEHGANLRGGGARKQGANGTGGGNCFLASGMAIDRSLAIRCLSALVGILRSQCTVSRNRVGVEMIESCLDAFHSTVYLLCTVSR